MEVDWEQIKILRQEYMDSCREFEKQYTIAKEAAEERNIVYKTMCDARATLEQTMFHPEKVNSD